MSPPTVVSFVTHTKRPRALKCTNVMYTSPSQCVTSVTKTHCRECGSEAPGTGRMPRPRPICAKMATVLSYVVRINFVAQLLVNKRILGSVPLFPYLLSCRIRVLMYAMLSLGLILLFHGLVYVHLVF